MLYWGQGLSDRPDYGKSHTQAQERVEVSAASRKGHASPAVETLMGTRQPRRPDTKWGLEPRLAWAFSATMQVGAQGRGAADADATSAVSRE